MFYITGDKHADFNFLCHWCLTNNTSTKDYLIILGDSGINYFSDGYEEVVKKTIKHLPITLLCVHGNHEERAENLKQYKATERFGGTVYIQSRYPNIIFLKSGETYKFADKTILVLGGAHSIDKEYRLHVGANWFESECLSPAERTNILSSIRGKYFDYVLSHTCPYSYQPRETFKYNLTDVDTTMEQFLDCVRSNISYKEWYCGHFHIDKVVDNIHFMMNDIGVLDV